jgi:hypothetical protein
VVFLGAMNTPIIFRSSYACISSLRTIVLLAHTLLGPLDRDVMIAGERLDPGLVVGGPLAQDLLAHHWDTEDLAEEVDDLFRPRQSAQIAMNDNAIEAVIDEDEKIAEQLGEQLHDRPSKTHQAWTGQAHG